MISLKVSVKMLKALKQSKKVDQIHHIKKYFKWFYIITVPLLCTPVTTSLAKV